MYLYFVASEVVPCVKIGITADLRRLTNLRVGCPLPLYLLGLVEFQDRRKLEKEEARLHVRFHYSKVRGEWFSLDSRLHEEITKYVLDSESLDVYNKTKFCSCGTPILDDDSICVSCYVKKDPNDLLAEIGLGPYKPQPPFPITPETRVINKSFRKRQQASSDCPACGNMKYTWQRFCQPCFNNGRR